LRRSGAIELVPANIVDATPRFLVAVGLQSALEDETARHAAIAALVEQLLWGLAKLGRADPDEPFVRELAVILRRLVSVVTARPHQDEDDDDAPHDHTVHRAAIVVRVRCLLALAILVCACAPEIPSPRERAAVSDLAADTALEHQLLAIPGVTGAHAAIHSAFRDPLTAATSQAAASMLIVIAPTADRGSVATAAHQLAPTATLAIVPGPVPAPSSRGKPLLIAALVVVLGAAGFVAWRTRPTA
jgi:hypothetical protein